MTLSTGLSSPFYYGRVAVGVGDDLRLEGVNINLPMSDNSVVARLYQCYTIEHT